MEQTPFMKAMHDFAMADPENCDREWAACVALANERMAALVSSPTSSTSPLHHQARATTALTAPSTTRSAATLRAPSGAASSEPATATPAQISAPAVSTENDLTPGARCIYDYLVGNSDYLDGDPAAPVSDTSYAFSNLEAVHGAVDITNSELTASTPITCSVECPSHHTSESMSMLTPLATPTWPTTTYNIIHEVSASVVCDETLPVVATCVAARPACSINCSDSEFGAPFPASLATHVSLSKQPPTAAMALGPAFIGQVQTTLSLASISSGIISIDIEDNLVEEESRLEKDVSWTNHVPSEALIIQFLKSYVHSELQTMMPLVYTAIYIETDMDVPMSMLIQDLNFNTKQQLQVLRPAPWPSLIADIYTAVKSVTTNWVGPFWECVSLSQTKPPWSHLAPVIHTSELMSDMRTDSGYLYIGGLLFELDFCARFRTEALLPAWVLSFSVGHVIQYGSERNCQILRYNGLTLQYCSYKGINSETTTHYVSSSFIWSIAWFQLLLLLHPLVLCLNMLMGDVVLGCHSPTLFIAEMRPACFQLDQLAKANLAAMVYMFAYAATTCYQFSSGSLFSGQLQPLLPWIPIPCLAWE